MTRVYAVSRRGGGLSESCSEDYLAGPVVGKELFSIATREQVRVIVPCDQRFTAKPRELAGFQSGMRRSYMPVCSYKFRRDSERFDYALDTSLAVSWWICFAARSWCVVLKNGHI